MAPDVFAVVVRVGSRYPTPNSAVDKCSIAVGQLLAELNEIGEADDVQRVEVRRLVDRRWAHPQLPSAHQLLRVRDAFVDVTWLQVDRRSYFPWKVYPSMVAIADDWREIRDWLTGRRLR